MRGGGGDGVLLTLIRRIFPSDAQAPPRFRWPRYVATLYLLVVVVRSGIHLFKSDGGAHSIATIDIAVPGGADIVAMFGQWGAVQLQLAVLLLILLWRWRGLTPLVLLTLLEEPFLRALAGHLKPLTAVGTPPGKELNWLVVPILGVAFIGAIWPREQDLRRQGACTGNN
ncbi:hypothetical protein [Acidisoma sp. 7E03]